jgi:hypothetical protein
LFIWGISGGKQDVNRQRENLQNTTGKLIAEPNWGNIPLYFIPNRGQVKKPALFYAKTSSYTLWLTKIGLIFDSIGTEPRDNVVSIPRMDRANPPHPFINDGITELWSYEVTESRFRDLSHLIFKNANPNPEITALGQTEHTVNYYIGDKSNWHTNIPTSKAALYKELYPNIDLKVYGIEKQIEYDFIVKPGGNVSDISFEYKNVKNTKVDSSGNLVITTQSGELKHSSPISYQMIDGKKIEVESGFKKTGNNTYEFNVTDFNPEYNLIIDPVILVYSTYLVRHGMASYTDVAVDNSGCAYVIGATDGCGYGRVFIWKLSADGRSLVYSTYLGGSKDEYGLGIAVDNSGYAYITGFTSSTDFPVLNPFMSDPGDGSWDVFVAKLSDTGGNLISSTYLGGNGSDGGHSIAVDNSGSFFVTGQTSSTDFPTQNSFMSGRNSYMDTFVTKFSADGQNLVYSTYLGGGEYDYGNGISVDSSGCAYVTGWTESTDFPTWNPFMTDPGDGERDAFITKLSAGGQNLVYSTYFGGGANDYGNGIAVDSSGCAYVTGETESTDFPTWNPFMSNQGGYDAFAAKLSADGQSLVYSTYLGGESDDYGYGITIDSSNCAYLTGKTASSNFPTENPLMGQGDYGAFVTKLSANGQSLVYSTYLSGSHGACGESIEVDSSGDAYVSGNTYGVDFPTRYPIRGGDRKGGYNFLSKLSLVSDFFTISGTVTESGLGLANVILNGLPGNPLTDASGDYNVDVPAEWSGTCIPTLSGYLFHPSSRAYTFVLSNQANHDYTATISPILSGTVTYNGSGLENVHLYGLPSNVETDASGEYRVTVGAGWSGTVTPIKTGFEFTPALRTYSDITTNQVNQNYTAYLSYNSPNFYLILPEVIWAEAYGSGTWQTEVQITDMAGGSEVSVYFSPYGDSRRGPFVLWTGPTADRSVKYHNILETLGSIDTGYDYFNKVGSIEFLTQGMESKIQIAARMFNGNYSKTFQALNVEEVNTASISRQMIIQNLPYNNYYRSAVGLFNTSGNTITVDLTLKGWNGNQLGSPFSKTLSAYEFISFNPFAAAGVPVTQGDNYIFVNPTSGVGKILCFGASSNYTTNDPAYHAAFQAGLGYVNSPSDYQVLPEVIWSPASGGGTWITEVLLTDLSGGSEVTVYFTPHGETRRDPFTLVSGWMDDNGNRKFDNILRFLDIYDSGYNYYGKVGAMEFVTQDSSHVISITSRIYNGNYSKKFQGLNYVEVNTASTVRQMMIQNLTSNDVYRSAVGCFNLTGDSLTADFSLIDGDGSVIGSTFTRTIAGNEFQAFNPFAQAGVPYPVYSYDNVWLYINPVSGAGEIMCFGTSSNNFSNDPASHVAVQYK